MKILWTNKDVLTQEKKEKNKKELKELKNKLKGIVTFIFLIKVVERKDEKVIESRFCDSNCLSDCIVVDGNNTIIYLNDEGDLCCKNIYNDKTVTHVYRDIVHGVGDYAVYQLIQKIKLGIATKDDMNKITKPFKEEVEKRIK